MADRIPIAARRLSRRLRSRFASPTSCSGRGAGHARAAGRFASALRLLPPDSRDRAVLDRAVTLVSDPGSCPRSTRVFAAVFEGTLDPADSARRHRRRRHRRRRRAASRPARPEPRLATHRPAASRPAPRPAGAESDAPRSTSGRVLAGVGAGGAPARRRVRRARAGRVAALSRLMRRLALATPPRRSPAHRGRRTAAANGSTCGATLRRPSARGGDPVGSCAATPDTRHAGWSLLCDVSGSMEPYARAFLLLLHGAVVRRRAPRRSSSRPG